MVEITTDHLKWIERCVVDKDDLRRLRNTWKLKSKRIAFTNGCFDLLHVGHLHTLIYAADRSDVLIVGVNSDASVTRLKGESRPLIGQAERARMVSAIGIVDVVVIFSDDTPLEVIKFLQPDLLVKGGDWKKEDVVGADVVEANGGQVEIVPYLEDWSTTDLETRLRAGG